MIIDKISSGAFSTTHPFYIRKNIGIDALFVVGVYTNGCVDTAVRAACDLGFLGQPRARRVRKATPELHETTIASHDCYAARPLCPGHRHRPRVGRN